VQALESIKVFSRHKYYLRLHFNQRWLTHFGCASGFLGLCHTFFGWNFILRHGTYQWSSYLGRCPTYFGHFVLMCSLSTFLYHMDNTLSFFLPIFFGEFQQENYVGMWGNYRFRIVGVFSRPFNKVSSLITNILWWYRPLFYGRLFPIFFNRELGSGGFPRFRIFDRPILEEYVYQVEGGLHLL